MRPGARIATAARAAIRNGACAPASIVRSAVSDAVARPMLIPVSRASSLVLPTAPPRPASGMAVFSASRTQRARITITARGTGRIRQRQASPDAAS